jgi:hypothetical protein
MNKYLVLFFLGFNSAFPLIFADIHGFGLGVSCYRFGIPKVHTKIILAIPFDKKVDSYENNL